MLRAGCPHLSRHPGSTELNLALGEWGRGSEAEVLSAAVPLGMAAPRPGGTAAAGPIPVPAGWCRRLQHPLGLGGPLACPGSLMVAHGWWPNSPGAQMLCSTGASNVPPVHVGDVTNTQLGKSQSLAGCISGHGQCDRYLGCAVAGRCGTTRSRAAGEEPGSSRQGRVPGMAAQGAEACSEGPAGPRHCTGQQDD